MTAGPPASLLWRHRYRLRMDGTTWWGYPTPEGSKEHLWFEAHAIGDDTIDATLENKPFAVDLTPGERAERPLDLLTDWVLMTPAGSVTPRSMSAARSLREHADEVRAAMAAGNE